jgi:osmotically-inducible protein OsmY
MAASAKKVRDDIDNAIKNSDEVKPGNYVTVKVEKQGMFGKPFIQLTGRCTSEKDKTKIEEIARANASDVKLESSLRVSTVS